MAKSTEPLLYHNEKYGFSLQLPRWWRSYVVIGKSRTDPDATDVLHFKFKYRDRIYEDIFTLLIYRMTREEWFKQGYGDSPVVLIAEHQGYLFAYVTPEELPYAFVNPATGDYDYRRYGKAIRILKRMVNDDVPRIVGTLQFSRTNAAHLSTPYLSEQVKHCGGNKRA